MKVDYWISMDGKLVFDPNLPPSTRYVYAEAISHWGFENHNEAGAYSDLSEYTDTDHFKVMLF
jgi:hypothetical protein